MLLEESHISQLLTQDARTIIDSARSAFDANHSDENYHNLQIAQQLALLNDIFVEAAAFVYAPSNYGKNYSLEPLLMQHVFRPPTFNVISRVAHRFNLAIVRKGTDFALSAFNATRDAAAAAVNYEMYSPQEGAWISNDGEKN